MALTLAQFREVIRRDKAMLDKLQAPVGVEKCPHCGVPIMEATTGNRAFGEENVCSDCYFEKWGDEVEQHPIFTPRIVRGADR